MIKKGNYITEERFDAAMKRIDERFENTDGKIDSIMEKLKKLDWIMEKLDWLTGKYKGHDEEHILITGRLSENTDRLETIERRLEIVVQ